MQRHRTIIKGISAFILHWERCSIKPTNIPLSHWHLVNCFIIFFVLNTAGVHLVFGFWSLFSTPGNISNGRSTPPQARLMEFAFLSTTSWLAPGRIYGYNRNWQGFDTGGLFFLFYLLSLRFFKDKRNAQQCTSLGRDRDRNPLLDSRFPDLFYNSFLSFARHREAFSEDTQQHQKGPTDPPTHSLRFFLPLALLPSYD